MHYAAELLGLGRAWKEAMLASITWPEHWLKDDVQKLVTNRIEDENYDLPSAEQAVVFLNRLADQFDKEAEVTMA